MLWLAATRPPCSTMLLNVSSRFLTVITARQPSRSRSRWWRCAEPATCFSRLWSTSPVIPNCSNRCEKGRRKSPGCRGLGELANLQLMDSVIKESQRVEPVLLYEYLSLGECLPLQKELATMPQLRGAAKQGPILSTPAAS
ncbi:hypothetical protein C8034_v003580 [Colletotrichum sidae]|uniref:Uncharacterized protein n=1 Tax=Colletotrichum sidae TaxID=1347389 RepID=A0A4R8TRK9_9PEZI|nr:hypothetical protein C8034_v003580 [Colletotrichum sidae]